MLKVLLRPDFKQRVGRASRATAPGSAFDDYMQVFSILSLPCAVGGAIYDDKNLSTISKDTHIWVNATDDKSGNFVEAPIDCTYSVQSKSVWSLAKFAQSIFNGTCVDDTSGFPHSADCWPVWWLNSFYNNGNATFRFVNDTVNNLTTSITNRWRLLGQNSFIQQDGNVTYADPGLVYGTVWQTGICTKFQWPWLMLPAILLAGTALLLIGTMVVGCRDKQAQPIWKYSILPPLLWGLDVNGQVQSARNTSPFQYMDTEAKCITAVLIKKEHGWTLAEVPGGVNRTGIHHRRLSL